jgi:hypothetical protein
MEGEQAPAAPANNFVNLPAGARVENPEDAVFVQTLLDNEIPRNRYDVVRSDDETKFVVSTNNNLGAESFIRVQRTPNGWKAVDPRQVDQNLKTIYEGNDRRVAEMHAMNRITGADGGQNPAPEAPAPARLMPTEIEIEGRGFRGVPSFNGNALTFYDDSGNEAATITRQPDGRTFNVSEPFGGNISVAGSYDDAIRIAGRKIQDNVLAGLMDESEAESSGPGTNLPPTPAPSTPESSAPSDIINGADGVAYTRDRGSDITTYSSPSGTNLPLRVTTPNNGVTWTLDNNGQTVNIFGTREEAEAYAEGLISGQPVNPPATPAPSVPSTPSGDPSLNALNVTLRGVKMTAERDDTGFSTYDENGQVGAYAIANGDGTFSVYDPSTGENEVVDTEAEAVILAGAINFNNIRGGFNQPKDSSEPSAPSQPALPTGYTSSPIGSGNNAYEVKHDTDKENTPYYLVEQDGGGFFMSKWDSQNSAEAQRFRRPAQRMTFGSREQADQWIADDLSSGGGDGGSGGGGGNPPSAPTTPPAGGNFATDRIPAGMTLQEKDRLNIIGPSGLQLGFNDVPNFQENRPKVYGYYSKVSEANGKYKAVIQGLPDGRAVLEFSSPEEAHNWVVENLSNFAPASPTPAPAAPTPAPPFNPVIPQGVIGKAAVREWIQENYGTDFDDVNNAVFNNYEEITPHLVDSLNLKRAFEGGFTELGTLPRWGDTNFRQGGSLPDAGINPNRKIQLSDGTFAYLKHTGMGTGEAFNEVMAARLFEAVGVNDLVAVSVKDPRRPNEYSVLTRELQGQKGETFGGDVNNLTNAREISLIDYLIENTDRHDNNWMINGNVAYPIDHGYAFEENPTSRPLPTDFREITLFNGNFSEPIERWVQKANPKNNPLFTREELTNIYTKINELRDNFVTHSGEKRRYFDEYIMPRLDALMKIWR